MGIYANANKKNIKKIPSAFSLNYNLQITMEELMLKMCPTQKATL